MDNAKRAMADTSVTAPANAGQINADPAKAEAAKTQAAPADLAAAPIAANLAEQDRAVAESLRSVLAAQTSDFIARPGDRAGVEAFYRERGFAPLWTENGAISPRAMAAISYLKGVEADGLDPADYPVPGLQGSDAGALAQDELRLVNSVLAYARHARTGRVHFSRVSDAAEFNLQYPEPAAVLRELAATSDIRQTLDGYEPTHPQYRALKAKLAELRSGAFRVEAPVQPQQPQPKKKGKAKHATEASKAPDISKQIELVIANMDRWRWVKRDLGAAHVIVNIPDYTLKVFNQGKVAWTTRVVVGKPGETATPLLSEPMKYITINPTWNVPPSIVKNEYLPMLQKDPTRLERMGLKVTRKKDGSLHISQPPGPKNALGQIRFNFPNQFSVYQHDTPAKHLFASAQRALSHGCVRVQHPEKYAEVLLSITQAKDGITAERVKSMYGDTERNIALKSPLTVHLTYQTAFVDDAGQLQFRKDIYGRDARQIAVLRNERAVADIPAGKSGQTAYAKAAMNP